MNLNSTYLEKITTYRKYLLVLILIVVVWGFIIFPVSDENSYLEEKLQKDFHILELLKRDLYMVDRYTSLSKFQEAESSFKRINLESILSKTGASLVNQAILARKKTDKISILKQSQTIRSNYSQLLKYLSTLKALPNIAVTDFKTRISDSSIKNKEPTLESNLIFEIIDHAK